MNRKTQVLTAQSLEKQPGLSNSELNICVARVTIQKLSQQTNLVSSFL